MSMRLRSSVREVCVSESKMRVGLRERKENRCGRSIDKKKVC